MRYFYVEPEVAGGLGPRTLMNSSAMPPSVTRLHYVFDGWLGDEIVEATPCFVVTERLAACIRDRGLTGVRFEQCEVDVSETFLELYPDRALPPFVWAKITGLEGKDDFFIANDQRLVVSERAWEVIKAYGENALVSEFVR